MEWISLIELVKLKYVHVDTFNKTFIYASICMSNVKDQDKGVKVFLFGFQKQRSIVQTSNP